MTDDEVLAFWEAYTNFRERRSMRKGQAMMNALGVVAPILYDMVTMTSADCFHRDDLIPNFMQTTGLGTEVPA